MPQASDCQIRCLPPTSGDIRRHSGPTDTRPCIHEEPARPPSARREPEAPSARSALRRAPSPLLRRSLSTNVYSPSLFNSHGAPPPCAAVAYAPDLEVVIFLLCSRFIRPPALSAGDHGVVHGREQPRVQFVGVCIDGVREGRDGGLLLRRCRSRHGRAIALVAFANQLAELHIDVLKAARLYEVLQRVGMQWALLRQVAYIRLEDRH